ncbi:Ras family protein [Entamoeba marina]
MSETTARTRGWTNATRSRSYSHLDFQIGIDKNTNDLVQDPYKYELYSGSSYTQFFNNKQPPKSRLSGLASEDSNETNKISNFDNVSSFIPNTTSKEMLYTEMKSLVNPTAPQMRISTINCYVSSYSNTTTFEVENQFKNINDYFHPIQKHVSSYHSNRNYYFTLSSNLGITEFKEFSFLNGKFDIYLVAVDNSYQSVSYAQNYLQQLTMYNGTKCLEQVCVVMIKPNSVMTHYCKDNEITYCDGLSGVKEKMVLIYEKYNHRRVNDKSGTGVNKKVLILGDYFVGKTSLFKLLTDSPQSTYESTETFKSKQCNLNGKPQMIDFYDIPGDFRLRALNKQNSGKSNEQAAVEECISYLHEKQIVANGVVVMYDSLRKETVDYAQLIIQEYKRISPQSIIIVVGNKEDLLENFDSTPKCYLFDQADYTTSLSLLKPDNAIITKFLDRIKFLLQATRLDLSYFSKQFIIESAVRVIENFDNNSDKEQKKLIGSKSTKIALTPKTTLTDYNKDGKYGIIVLTESSKTLFVFKKEESALNWKKTLLDNINVSAISKAISTAIVQHMVQEALSELISDFDQNEDVESFAEQVKGVLPSNNYSFPAPIMQDPSLQKRCYFLSKRCCSCII